MLGLEGLEGRLALESLGLEYVLLGTALTEVHHLCHGEATLQILVDQVSFEGFSDSFDLVELCLLALTEPGWWVGVQTSLTASVVNQLLYLDG